MRSRQYRKGLPKGLPKGLLAGAASTVLLTAGFAALSQGPVQKKPLLPSDPIPPKASQKPESKKKLLNITYEEMKADDSTKTTDFTKAVIRDMDEGTTFEADKMRVVDKTGVKTATATGNPVVRDKQADVTGDKAVIHYAKSKRLVVVTGNVNILVKPKQKTAEANPADTSGPAVVSFPNGKPMVDAPKPGEDEDKDNPRKHPATITCDKVEYEYAKDKKKAVLTGNFKVVQKLTDNTRTLTAEHAEWFGNEEKIILFAPVHVEDAKGMKTDTKEQVVVFTKEGAENLVITRGVTELPVDDEEDEPVSPKSGTTGGKPAEGGKPAGGEKPPVTSTPPPAVPNKRP